MAILNSTKGLFETIEARDEHEKTVKHFQCLACELDFSIFSDWQKHRNDDPTCKALTCPKCQKNFQDSKSGYKCLAKNIQNRNFSKKKFSSKGRILKKVEI